MESFHPENDQVTYQWPMTVQGTTSYPMFTWKR